MTPDEIFETIFAREVRAELDRELLDFALKGIPMQSTPIIFESKEDEEAFKKNWDEVVNRNIDL